MPMNEDKFVASFLYKEAVKEEKKDRKNEAEKHDYEIIDTIIAELNQRGYRLKYAADLRLRKFHDKEIIPIISKYYMKFDNLGYAEDLIGMIAKKGFYESTPLVIQLYDVIKNQEGLHQIASCDNALSNINDKRHLNTYIDYLKNEEDFIRLPLTMIMLAKWKVPEAKEYFCKYLNSAYRESIFIAIECLSYYDDPNGILKNAISLKLTENDNDIVVAAKKALKRMCKKQ